MCGNVCVLHEMCFEKNRFVLLRKPFCGFEKTFSAFEKKIFLGFEKNIFLKTFPGVEDKPFSAFWRKRFCAFRKPFTRFGETQCSQIARL